jgi:acylphosphatase
MDAKKTYKFVLSGRVQGVGFRYFAHSKARTYNITGYVKNTPDGRVEILCQGKPDDLDGFIRLIKEGPSFSNVENVDEAELKESPYYDYFEIKY